MIEAQGLTKKFGRRYALRDVSFNLCGKIAVLGYNGAGKSTLAKIIAGIVTPTEGEVRVFGRNPAKSPEVRKKIGIVSHNPMLYKELTVRENLEFYSRVYGCDAEISELARTFGFTKFLGRKVSELSRGYLQRVALAKALLNQPDLLILDEITAGLDAGVRDGIIEFIKDYSGSVIFTTHLLEEADFCEHFLVLRDGMVEYLGSEFEMAIKAIRSIHEVC